MTTEFVFFSIYSLRLTLTGEIFAWVAMLLIWCVIATRSYRFFWAFTTPKKGVDLQEQLIKETVEKSKSGDDCVAKPFVPEKDVESVQAIEARMERLEKKYAKPSGLAVKQSVLEVLPSGEKKETSEKKPDTAETVNFLLVNEKGLVCEPQGNEPPKSGAPVRRRKKEDEITVWNGDSLEIVNPDSKDIKFNDNQASSMLSMLDRDSKNKEEYRAKRAGIKNFLGKNRLFNWTNLILAAAGLLISFFCRQAMPGYYILAVFLAFLLPLPVAMLMHKILGR